MAYLNSKKVKRLRTAITDSMDELKDAREKRVEFIRQYIGKHYSTKGTEEKVPLNLLELTVNTYTNAMVAQTPSASVTTQFPQYEPVAYSLKIAIDHLAQEINLGDTLRKATVDSLFSIGVIKTGINYSKSIELGGFTHDVGQPYADVVQLDDLVFDTSAYSWEQCCFIGDRVKLDIQDVKQCGLYSKSVVKKLMPLDKNDRNQEATEGERSSNLSNNEEHPDGETIYGQCQLWNIWLPKENLIVTLADQEGLDEPLAVEEWHGPETGPYDVLDYSYVPGNILPLAPMASLIDLHDITNRLFNKTVRQAERQKTILGYTGAGSKDAERIIMANDGESIRMDDPKSAQEFKFGGPDQINVGYVATARQYFSMFAGNLDSIAGLGPQADTAKQEQLIKESSSQRMAAYQSRVVEFATKIVKKLAFYLWNDPLINLPLTKPVEGTDIKIPFNFTPEILEGDFLEYNIEIVPYSLKQQTPSQKVQKMLEMLQYYAPYYQFMIQDGLKIDWEEINNIIADYTNLPELTKVITTGMPDDNPAVQPVGQPNPKIQGQQKEYMHSYQSQGSAQGAEGVAMQNMFSAQGGGQNGMNMPMTGAAI